MNDSKFYQINANQMIQDYLNQLIESSFNFSSLKLFNYSSFISKQNLSDYDKLLFLKNSLNNLIKDIVQLSHFALNNFNKISLNLQNNCNDTAFECTILVFLFSLLFIIFGGIIFSWKFFGINIDYFYTNQGLNNHIF